MKKLLFVFGIMLMCACSNAKDPIHDYFKSNIADMDSFEEIERTTLPSFIIADDTIIFQSLNNVMDLDARIDRNNAKSDSLNNVAKSLFGNPDNHQMILNIMEQTDVLLDDFAKLSNQRDSIMGCLYEHFDQHPNRADSLNIVNVRYRFRDNSGIMQISENVFVLVPDESKIVRVMDANEYETITQIVDDAKNGNFGWADNPYRLKAKQRNNNPNKPK